MLSVFNHYAEHRGVLCISLVEGLSDVFGKKVISLNFANFLILPNVF
jgi:hypothetical protein